MPDKKITILFVDNDQVFLSDLFVMLQDMQDKWEPKFAYSGKEAIEIIKKTYVDVIISNIKLSDIDGMQLLKKAKDLYPKIICIIMSENECDNPDKVADNFLKKPISLDKLKNVILNPIDFLDRNKIRLFILKMDKLPTIPNLYLELQKVIKSDDFSFSDISKIVEKDVTMTAKVLQFVNSAYFGLKHPIYDILHAVTYLGIETLKSIVLTLNIFCEFSEKEMEEFFINELYNHSLAVSCLMSTIIQTAVTEDSMAEESTVAGMLHDIGKLVLIKNKPKEYKDIFQIHKRNGLAIHIIENQYFGVDHAEVGSFLTEVWGFSQNLVYAINNHHNPYNALKPPLSINSAVYIANILEHDHDSPEITEEHGKIQNFLNKTDQTENLFIWREFAKKLKENAKKSKN